MTGPASEADAIGLELDELDDSGQLERWAKSRYGGTIDFDLKGMDPGIARDVLKQFDKMAREYPKVAQRLEYVGTLQERPPLNLYPGYWDDPINYNARSAFAFADGGRALAFNPYYFGDPAAMDQALDASKTGKWLDADNSVRGVVAHEFGHLVEEWLLDSTMGDFVETFNKNNTPERDLSQYATITNDDATSPHPELTVKRSEGWGEAFSAIQRTPPESWPTYVHNVNNFINAVKEWA